MSVDLFYPDNRNRARRVEQLTHDITGMQGNVTRSDESLDETDERMAPLLDAVLKENGMTSFSELIDKVATELSEEERDGMYEILDEIEKTNQGFQQAFGTTLIVCFVSGSVLKGPKLLSKLVSCSAVKVSMRFAMRSIKLGINGALQQSKIFARVANAITKITTKKFSAAQHVAKACRFIKIGSKMLSIVGFVTEAILMILAAIEGAKQRDGLKEATKDYFSKRINVALLEELARDAASFEGTLQSILHMHDQFKDESFHDEVIASMTTSVAENLDTMWSTRMHESSADTWADIDISRSSWIDEDPSVKEAIEFLDSLEDQDIDIDMDP